MQLLLAEENSPHKTDTTSRPAGLSDFCTDLTSDSRQNRLYDISIGICDAWDLQEFLNVGIADFM